MMQTSTRSLVDTPAWAALYRNQAAAELVPDYPDMLSAFRVAVERNGADAALHYFDETISYQALDNDSDALAFWLQEQGVQATDRVLILCQNMPAFPMMMLAAWKIGAVPVPINPMYRGKELARLLADSVPAAILCETVAEPELSQAMAENGMQALPVVICVSNVDGMQSEPDRPNSLYAILSTSRDKTPRPYTASSDDLGLILYTSGTTGFPKGAMITQASLAFNGQAAKEWFDLRPESRMFAMAPFFHITGFVSHLCATIVGGCSNIINYRFSPELAVEMIRKWQPTHTVGAITAINALSMVPGVSASDMASFKEVYSGGAPIPPVLNDALVENLGFRIHPVYGMTELAGPAVFTPFGLDAPVMDGHMSIGIPIPSTELIIVDPEGRVQPTGEAGEVLIRGPQVMRGYWRNPEETTAALKDGWMCTGDVGFIDKTGWVYLVDRKKDVIIASGFKVWPREVEDVLYTHPAVREAAVVGIADDYRGETVKACISLKDSAAATPQEIIEYCRENLTGYKIPRHVEIVPDLPKTVSGKIQRSELRETS